MRILVYGLQSSGASLITYYIAQREYSLAYLDLYQNEIFPKIPDEIKEDLILKCTISPTVSLAEQINNFKPDKIILVLRDPFTNYASLKLKPYSGSNQELARKLAVLEKVFNAPDIFDTIINYEDFIFKPKLVASQLEKVGITLPIVGHNFQRSKQQIFRYTTEKSKSLGIKIYNRVGNGNIHTKSKKVLIKKDLAFLWLSKKDQDVIRGLCPKLCNHYDDYLKELPVPSQKILFFRTIKALCRRKLITFKKMLLRNGKFKNNYRLVT